MARKVDIAKVQEGLVQAFKQGDEAQARLLVAQLGSDPRQGRVVLDAMLKEPSGIVRQAAAFGLGELGGEASIRRLEQQLAIEEARGDYDGEAVAEEISRALGRIEDVRARESLMRRLERLTAAKQEYSDVYEIARALWKRRHADLLPAVKRSLERISLPAPHGLHGLLVLLEKSPADLGAWAQDPAVPVEYKTRALVVLAEDVPDTLIGILPSFISMAHLWVETAVSQRGGPASFCESLFSLLIAHQERILPALPEEARVKLRMIAQSLIAAVSLNCSIRAAVMLKLVGRPEDAVILEAARPDDPTLAKVFTDAARALRSRQKN
ncbi:MAG TPA: hypothetical protein VK539_38775 [Myxococcaceae bacterium]|nr:hypothetical protein [Myxococcaceae bacterium]